MILNYCPKRCKIFSKLFDEHGRQVHCNTLQYSAMKSRTCYSQFSQLRPSLSLDFSLVLTSLSLFHSLSIYLSVCLSLYLSLFQSLFFFLSLSLSLSLSPYSLLCISLCMTHSIHFSVSLSHSHCSSLSLSHSHTPSPSLFLLLS